jgi:hypothetical protein
MIHLKVEPDLDGIATLRHKFDSDKIPDIHLKSRGAYREAEAINWITPDVVQVICNPDTDTAILILDDEEGE